MGFFIRREGCGGVYGCASSLLPLYRAIPANPQQIRRKPIENLGYTLTRLMPLNIEVEAGRELGGRFLLSAARAPLRA